MEGRTVAIPAGCGPGSMAARMGVPPRDRLAVRGPAWSGGRVGRAPAVAPTGTGMKILAEGRLIKWLMGQPVPYTN